MTLRLRHVAVLALLCLTLAGGSPAAAAETFPSRIELPPGFRPEGIVIGAGTTFYVGSIPTGAVSQGDLRTGELAPLIPASLGSAAIGLAFDHGLLFVAGGPTGQARVIDTRSRIVLATYQLATGTTFINDVVVVGEAAWFTDSRNPVLYRVPLDLTPAQTIQLSGDLVYEPGTNVNGIDATPDGKTLILVQTNTGELFTADPASGATQEIDLGSESVPFGDGILLHGGRTLYVVQNSLNRIAVIELAPDLESGNVVERFGHANFDVPTTIDRFGKRLYAVNARFSTPPTPQTEYWITAVLRP